MKSVSPAVRQRLLSYEWPGNVRQLRNVIESMVVVDFDSVLDVDDLPSELSDGMNLTAATTNGTSINLGDTQHSLAGLVGKPLAEIERLFITETLNATNANREQAAEMLQIGERTLYRKSKNMGCKRNSRIHHNCRVVFNISNFIRYFDPLNSLRPRFGKYCVQELSAFVSSCISD